MGSSEVIKFNGGHYSSPVKCKSFIKLKHNTVIIANGAATNTRASKTVKLTSIIISKIKDNRGFNILKFTCFDYIF